MNDNDSSSSAARDFLARLVLTILIGFAVTLPCVFFAPTRKVLRFIRDLEAVQTATELFQFAIVIALVGLIVQGLFHALRSGLRSFFPEDVNGTRENRIRE